MPEDNNKLTADIYGFLAEPSQEEKAVQFSINDMLRSQYRQAEQQRTNAAQMAKFSALGNVMQTLFNPIGWRAGGGNSGTTSQTATPDQQGYITAFNNIQRADQDIANIGRQGDNLRLNYAMQQAGNARRSREKMADMYLANEFAQQQQDQKHENRMKEIEARYMSRENLERLKAQLKLGYKFVDSDGKVIDAKIQQVRMESLARQYAKLEYQYYAGMTDRIPSWEEFIAAESGKDGVYTVRTYDRGQKPKNAVSNRNGRGTGDSTKSNVKHAGVKGD